MKFSIAAVTAVVSTVTFTKAFVPSQVKTTPQHGFAYHHVLNCPQISALALSTEDLTINEIENDVSSNLGSLGNMINHGQFEEAEKILVETGASRSIYHELLSAYVRLGRLKEARSLLNNMPDAITVDYNLLLSGYSRLGLVEEIEQLLEEMVSSKPGTSCQPDPLSYSHLLNVLAEKGEAKRAEGVFDVMVKLFGEENIPSLSYNYVLKAWKNIRGAKYNDVAVQRSEEILEQMEDIVDRISYTTFIGTLANTRNHKHAQRSQDILFQMLESNDDDVLPSVQTWNGVLLAWVRSSDPAKAEMILNQMEERDDVQPNVVSYAIVMDGWAKKSQIQRMEILLNRMEEQYKQGNEKARPNEFPYVTMIHAYSKQKDEQSAEKAEKLLFKMYDAYKNDGNNELKPNTKLVTAVMDAWQGSRDGPERAEKLLDWMISLQDKDLAPNEYSFSAVINAWSKSRKIGKSIRARQVLNKMIQLYELGSVNAIPNTICYTGVINTCAYCENDDIEKQNSLRIAISTYKDLQNSKYANPNHVTYTSLLTAIRNLLPISPKRSTAIRDIFTSAADNGFVDDNVLLRLKTSLQKTELESILPEGINLTKDIRANQLPHEWCRNVKLSS